MFFYPQVWGFCKPGDDITVRVNEHVTTAVLSVVQNQTIWTVFYIKAMIFC